MQDQQIYAGPTELNQAACSWTNSRDLNLWSYLWEKTCGKSTPAPHETFVAEEHQIKIACEQSVDLAYIFCLHVLGFLLLQADCLKSPSSLSADNLLADNN